MEREGLAGYMRKHLQDTPSRLHPIKKNPS